MNTNTTTSIAFLILNDLFHMNVIDKETYTQAIHRINSTNINRNTMSVIQASSQFIGGLCL